MNKCQRQINVKYEQQQQPSKTNFFVNYQGKENIKGYNMWKI